MQVEQLERLLQQHHPRLIYTNPTFQNPTGTCLGAVRRRRLIALADRYNIPILEDDFAGELRYDGRAQPALKALDPGGRVIYVGTFSKLLMPGLRIGFLVAEGPVYPLLTRLKAAPGSTDFHVDAAGAGQLRYRRPVPDACAPPVPGLSPPARCDARGDRSLYAGGNTGPSRRRVGCTCGCGLPDGVPAAGLLPYAAEEGVQFTAGGRLFPEPDDSTSYLRLNFARQPPEQIEEGMRRLSRALGRLQAAGYSNSRNG